MGRASHVVISSVVSIFAVLGGAGAQGVATQPLAQPPSTLLCTGTYYENGVPAAGAPATEGRATQFTLKMSYVDSYIELKASEWPGLAPLKDDPLVVRSVKFVYDDNIVKAMFPSVGNEFKGKLVSLGLGGISGDLKGVITLNRKTGDFTYPNTAGHCEIVKEEEKPNKF